MNEESAYILSLKALTYIMGDDILMPRFLTLSGLSENEISERLEDAVFLAACLDFLMNNEKDLLCFCDDSNISPKIPMQAYQLLGGTNEWNSL